MKVYVVVIGEFGGGGEKSRQTFPFRSVTTSHPFGRIWKVRETCGNGSTCGRSLRVRVYLQLNIRVCSLTSDDVFGLCDDAIWKRTRLRSSVVSASETPTSVAATPSYSPALLSRFIYICEVPETPTTDLAERLYEL